MPRIVAVSGSPAPASRSRLLAGWTGSWLRGRQFEVDAIDVRDLPAEEILFARSGAPALKGALEILARADGVVIVTPVYKASYSGLLKVFLDLLPQTGFRGKVVLPLAVGGSSAHVLAIDYALRPVLAALDALHVTAGLFFLDKELERTAEGDLRIAPPMEGRLNQALDAFVRGLQLTNLDRPAPLPGAEERAAASGVVV
jgi:FMN reductase